MRGREVRERERGRGERRGEERGDGRQRGERWETE